METEDKIIDLETRMIYAENTIDELNKTIATQNNEMDNIRKVLPGIKTTD